MKRIHPFGQQITLAFTLTCFALLISQPELLAQESRESKPKSNTNHQRTDYVSDASYWVASFNPKFDANEPKDMVESAQAFLKTLSDDEKKVVVHKLNSPERRLWTNLPADPDGGGMRLAVMNEEQVKAACQMFACMLSRQGYHKVIHIMLADDQLLKNGRPRRGFGTENFALVVFGTPDEEKPWGIQIDGHHVGMNISVEGDKNTISPSFIGTQPHSFQIGGESFRPFARETGNAYDLLNSLTDDQTKAAVLANQRNDLVTGPGTDGQVPDPEGMMCSELNSDQRKLLLSLIEQWINDLPAAQAEARMKELESEIDKMRFSWRGQTKAKSDISYRIQGPSLIIEYACQNLGGNPLDHLHSMYRNPQNEYGGQLKK